MSKTDRIISKAKSLVATYAVENVVKDREYPREDVNVLFFSRTLSHAKVYLATSIPGDGLYEVVYNGEKGEFYLTVYKHWCRKSIKDIPEPIEACEDCTDE